MAERITLVDAVVRPIFLLYRFAARFGIAPGRLHGFSMSRSAREVLIGAMQISKLRDSDFVYEEHILCSVFANDKSPAIRLLAVTHNISIDGPVFVNVRSTAGLPPLSPHLSDLLLQSREEQMRRRRSILLPEHILLAVLSRNGHSSASMAALRELSYDEFDRLLV